MPRAKSGTKARRHGGTKWRREELPFVFHSVPSCLRAFVPLLILLLAATAAHAQSQLFDSNWKFFKGDASGAAEMQFDDSAWRTLDVPHDWSIEGPIDEKNPTGKAGAFMPGGIGWYRKHFTLPQEDANKRIFIDFDGVMANSDVAINGFALGHRPYGYVSFRYELTGHLHFGAEPNVISVRCDNSVQPASRWYSGAGIYRHVHLTVTDPIHLAHWGVVVTTPKITADQAIVHVHATVVNQSDAAARPGVSVTILDPDGKSVSGNSIWFFRMSSLAAGKTRDFDEDIPVDHPRLWNLDQPNLYGAVVEVSDGTQTVDTQTVPFGIREFHFDPATGFWLNGKNFKIYGCCLHADGGALGDAVPLSIWQRRLEALKSVGCNAIRTAHNPQSPEFLDLCDRMGFLVMDEMFDVWMVGKTPLTSRTTLADYHLHFKDWWQRDVTDTVMRDRNHPSVILYSAGNEIHDIAPNNGAYFGIFRGLNDLYHKLDPTRPVTLALLRPNQSHVYDNGFAQMMDVVGQNYRENELVAAHQAHPSWKIIGTENRLDPQAWRLLRDTPAYAGQFIWTGVDYLGESGNWPMIAHSSGLFDRTLWPAAGAAQAKSWWTTTPMVSIFRVGAPIALRPLLAAAPGMDAGPPPRAQLLADWTNRADAHVETVEVYTNCQQVDLLLNGKSLGSKSKHSDDTPLRWTVPYQAGTLKAVATNNGQVVATDSLRSAGKPAKIVLTADRQTLADDFDDVCFVRATVTDDNGVTVPDAKPLIQFSVNGPGRIIGVDNSDNSDHTSFIASERHAYRGRCLAIVRATAASGAITIGATAAGFPAASIDLSAASN
jgi:beta-galactosidase